MELDSGYELDEQIAEKVMNWRRRTYETIKGPIAYWTADNDNKPVGWLAEDLKINPPQFAGNFDLRQLGVRRWNPSSMGGRDASELAKSRIADAVTQFSKGTVVASFEGQGILTSDGQAECVATICNRNGETILFSAHASRFEVAVCKALLTAADKLGLASDEG